MKQDYEEMLGRKLSRTPRGVRGLKQRGRCKLRNPVESHPAWVRGLKQDYEEMLGRKLSRTPRGCVD